MNRVIEALKRRMWSALHRAIEATFDAPTLEIAAHNDDRVTFLVHVALHFDPQSEEDWEQLGNAALALQRWVKPS